MGWIDEKQDTIWTHEDENNAGMREIPEEDESAEHSLNSSSEEY